MAVASQIVQTLAKINDSADGFVQLDINSNPDQVIIGIDSGFYFKLPDALILDKGHQYQFVNKTDYSVLIKDYSGALVLEIFAHFIGYVVLGNSWIARQEVMFNEDLILVDDLFDVLVDYDGNVLIGV